MVNTIRISDHVNQASGYHDGQIIFDLIVPSILAGIPIKVSFLGITAAPSAFINAAFIQLLEVTSIDQIRANLIISDSTKFINEMIKNRFEFSLKNPNNKKI